MTAGVNLVHVPYRGVAPALTDLLGGQVQVYLRPRARDNFKHIRSGRVRALAVTKPPRLEVLPDVPTVEKLVPGYEVIGFFGVRAPRNTPIEIVTSSTRK